MNISRIKLTLCVAALGVGLCGGWPVPAADSALKIGDAFPELAKFPLDGKLPDPLKGKIVVVDFWASWCGPCSDSFPAMEELSRRFRDKGVIFLAVNVDESRAAMDEFLKLHPVSFTIVRDAKKKLVAEVNIASMPTSFVLDREGRVLAIHKGFRGAETRQKYVKEIEDLLAAK